MRLRIRHALFMGFAAVIGVFFFTLALLDSRGVRPQMVAAKQEEVRRELDLAAQILLQSDGMSAEAIAGLVTSLIGYRTTIIAEDGTVLGDSDVSELDLPGLENHATRPEVLGALPGGVSFSERESATLGTELLYGARRAELGGESIVLRIAAPMTEIEAAMSANLRSLGIAGALSLTIALILGYLISVRLSIPLQALAGRMTALGRGDFAPQPIRPSRLVEVSQLSTSLTWLSDELQAHLAEIQRDHSELAAILERLAEGVVILTEDAKVVRVNEAARVLLELPEDIPSLVPIGTLLRQPELRELLEGSVARPIADTEVAFGERHLILEARPLEWGGAMITLLDVTEIRRLEIVRRDFVANASHEIKTPLTVLRGFAETLLEDDTPPEVRREFLQGIHANAVRLQHLVDDLLDLTRLESGGWVAKAETLGLGAAVADAWAGCAVDAKDRQVAFRLDGDAEVAADARGLNQIFTNLFDNAMRFVGEGGSVEVSIRPLGDLVSIEVQDDGTGMPSAALPRIFERFYRVDPSRSRAEGGTGLGLAIVRHLVVAMGGEVWAESQLGQGTTIHLTLPKSVVERR